jgi:lysophospholipase L1-like esterase
VTRGGPTRLGSADLMRRLRTAVTGTALFALAAGCLTACQAQAEQRTETVRRPPTSAPSSPRPASPPLRVMPLGDSITDGLQVPGGYRTDLWEFMAADGMAVDFVGSQAGGPAQLPDRDHEGHPGWRMGQIYLQARSWVRTYRPQVVLLDIGTNDVLQDKELEQAPTRLSMLINLITSTSPETRVYVATIGPFARRVDEARAARYDAAIPTIARTLTQRGRHVQAVDMHAALGKGDLAPDGIHPTAGGYSKMAARWYTALTGSSMTRLEAENPAYATVNNGVRLQTPDASGNGKVGYLNYADSYVEFTLQVPRAARYRMYAHAADGMGRPCDQRLSVNGKPQENLRFPDVGWDEWTIRSADLSLIAGRNTIRFSPETCSTEIDAIDLRVMR